MPPTLNEELIMAQVKLLLNSEIDKMHDAVRGQINEIFTDKVTPLIGQVARESAEQAAEKAVKKYCARIGIDFDNIEQMREHSLDMTFIRQLRRERDSMRSIVLSSTLKTIVTAVVAGMVAFFAGKFLGR